MTHSSSDIASSLHTCGSIPLGPMDLCLSIPFKCFLRWPCSGEKWFLPLVSRAWACWKPKKVFGTLVFAVFCHQVSWPIQQQAHNFPDISSAADVFPSVLLVAFHHSHEIQLHLDLSFLSVPLNPQTVPLHFLGHLSQLLPLAHFCFMFEIFWEFLVHPCRAPATLAWLPAHGDTFQWQSHSSAYLHTFHFCGSSLRHIEPTLIMTLILLVHCFIPN